MEIKIFCACGAKYKFDVEPVNGRMPRSVSCPVCAADGTAQANQILQQNLPPAASPAPAPKIVPAAIRLTSVSPAAGPIVPSVAPGTAAPAAPVAVRLAVAPPSTPSSPPPPPAQPPLVAPPPAARPGTLAAMLAPPPVAASSKSGLGPVTPLVPESASAGRVPMPPLVPAPAVTPAPVLRAAAPVPPPANALAPLPLKAASPPPSLPAPFPAPFPGPSQSGSTVHKTGFNWRKLGSIAVVLAMLAGTSGLKWYLRSTRSQRWGASSRQTSRAAGKTRESTVAADAGRINFRADDQTILIVKHTNDLDIANACLEFWRDSLRQKLVLVSTKDALFEEGQIGVMPPHHGAVEIVGPKTWPKSQAESLTLHLSQHFNTLAIHTWENDFSGEWLFTVCENGRKQFHADMTLKDNTRADAETITSTEGHEWATSHGFKPGPAGFNAFDEDDAERILKKLGFKLWDRKDESFSYALKQ